MTLWTWLLLLDGVLSAFQAAPSESPLAFCAFSRLAPGRFGDFAARGFPEYH